MGILPSVVRTVSQNPADKLKSVCAAGIGRCRPQEVAASGGGGGHLPQLLLEIAELVAQPGGQLEVEV